MKTHKQEKNKTDFRTLMVRIVAITCAVLIAGSSLLAAFL
jgi:hypothetical protein